MELRISLLNFNFAFKYLVHKIIVLIQNHLNYLQNYIFEFFFMKYNRLLLLLLLLLLFQWKILGLNKKK